MSALDKIIEEILIQAGAEADGILHEAHQKAAAILEQGGADREEWKRKFDEIAEQEYREITNRAESVNRQSRRRALLEARNQVIDEVMTEAKATLVAQAEPERFKIVAQGNILLNNSIEAIFEAEWQPLRDKAYEVLTADA